MLAQEIFDKSVGALLKQNKVSIGESGCYYKTSCGLRCAVGHLIPDEMYNPKMESINVMGLLGRFPELKPFMVAEDLQVPIAHSLLNRLQFVHDALSTTVWKEEYQKLAKMLELNWNFGD